MRVTEVNSRKVIVPNHDVIDSICHPVRSRIRVVEERTLVSLIFYLFIYLSASMLSSLFIYIEVLRFSRVSFLYLNNDKLPSGGRTRVLTTGKAFSRKAERQPRTFVLVYIYLPRLYWRFNGNEKLLTVCYPFSSLYGEFVITQHTRHLQAFLACTYRVSGGRTLWKRSRRAVTRLVLRRCGSFLLSWDSQVSLEGSRLAYSTTVIVSCLLRRLFRVPIQLVFFELPRFSLPLFRATPCITGIKFQTYFWQNSGLPIFFVRLRFQSFSLTGITRQASLFCLQDTTLLKRVATIERAHGCRHCLIERLFSHCVRRQLQFQIARDMTFLDNLYSPDDLVIN